MNNIQFVAAGLGKRKTSIAKVFLKQGSGILSINNKNSIVLIHDGARVLISSEIISNNIIF